MVRKNSASSLIGALVVSCALGSNAWAQVLRWATQGDLQTVDPYSQNEQLTNAVNGQVYETLVGRDRQLAACRGPRASRTPAH